MTFGIEKQNVWLPEGEMFINVDRMYELDSGQTAGQTVRHRMTA